MFGLRSPRYYASRFIGCVAFMGVCSLGFNPALLERAAAIVVLGGWPTLTLPTKWVPILGAFGEGWDTTTYLLPL